MSLFHLHLLPHFMALLLLPLCCYTILSLLLSCWLATNSTLHFHSCSLAGLQLLLMLCHYTIIFLCLSRFLATTQYFHSSSLTILQLPLLLIFTPYYFSSSLAFLLACLFGYHNSILFLSFFHSIPLSLIRTILPMSLLFYH
jgi:hypothetical protein